MSTFYKDVPLISATTFNVPAQSLGDGTATYGTLAHASTAGWVLGSVLKGRRILVTINTGAAASSPTHLRCALYEDDNANGSSPTMVTGTDNIVATPAGNTSYSYEIDPKDVVSTTYYSLGLDLDGAGSATLIAGATARFLDPSFKS